VTPLALCSTLTALRTLQPQVIDVAKLLSWVSTGMPIAVHSAGPQMIQKASLKAMLVVMLV